MHLRQVCNLATKTEKGVEITGGKEMPWTMLSAPSRDWMLTLQIVACTIHKPDKFVKTLDISMSTKKT